MTLFSHSEFDNHQRVAFVTAPESGLRAINASNDTGLISAEESAAKIEGIGATLATVFETAKRQNITTEAAAHALANDLVSRFE